MSKTDSKVSDLESLSKSLFDVYNAYDTGNIDSKEAAIFIKIANGVVNVKSQILQEKKFELQINTKRQLN